MEKTWKNILSVEQIGISRRLYVRGLLVVLIITFLPLSLIGGSIYYFSAQQTEKTVKRYHEAQFTRTVEVLDDHLSQIELTISRWAFNSLYNERLRDLGITYDPAYIKDIYNSLFILKESNPLIEDVQLFVRHSRQLYTEDGGVVSLPQGPLLERYLELGTKNPFLNWVFPMPKWDTPNADGKLAIIHRLPVGSVNPAGYLVVFLSEEKLKSLFRLATPDWNGMAFLLSSDGLPIYSMSNDPNRPLINSLIEEVGLSDKVIQKTATLQGEKYYFSALPIKRSGTTWTFVAATSLSILQAPVFKISRLVLVLSVLGMFVAAVLVWIASKELYRPIRRMVELFSRDNGTEAAGSNELQYIENQWNHLMKQSELLQSKLKTSLPALRESFLLHLVQGQLDRIPEQQLQDRMAQLGWRTENSGFSVLVVQLVEFSKETGRFQPGDEQLVAYASANIIQELADARFGQSGNMHLQNLSIGLIVIYPQNQMDEMKQELYTLSNEIIDKLHTLFQIRVTIGLGKPVHKIGDLTDSFQEARLATRRRLVNEVGQILDMEERYPKGREQAKYPYELENGIIHAIRRGDEEEAISIIRQFRHELERDAGTEYIVHSGIIQLFSNVLNAFLKSGFNPYSILQTISPYEELAGRRDLDEAIVWITQHLVIPFCNYMKESIEQQGDEIRDKVNQVIDMICKHYADDLSLEWCADAININPYVLSKTFKQVTGINFIDYITKVRLDRSKELLTATDMRINDIAERVGYQPTYFNRIFKKHERITPSQYRDLSEGSAESL